MPKKLSVSDELHSLERAVEGARELARHAEESDEDHTRWMQPRIGAVLDLVAARLHDFGRVVRGEVDPGLFAAPHSAIVTNDEEADEEESPVEDIQLESWAPDRLREEGEALVARANALASTKKTARR